jgi:hypothetical protein
LFECYRAGKKSREKSAHYRFLALVIRRAGLAKMRLGVARIGEFGSTKESVVNMAVQMYVRVVNHHRKCMLSFGF